MSKKFVPPSFGAVEAGIYRCGLPELRHFPFLESLELRTVVLLISQQPPPELLFWLQENGIRCVVPPELATSREAAVSETVVLRVLSLLLDPQNHPVLITCASGHYRTGTVVGCLRKLQRWSFASILSEHRRFCGEKTRVENEEFVELFDTDLVQLPQNPPPFLY